jgi:hypothetical protein
MDSNTLNQSNAPVSDVEAAVIAGLDVQKMSDPAWKDGDTDRHPAEGPSPVWARYIDSRLKQFCSR